MNESVESFVKSFPPGSTFWVDKDGDEFVLFPGDETEGIGVLPPGKVDWLVATEAGIKTSGDGKRRPLRAAATRFPGPRQFSPEEMFNRIGY
jgi:hypothetical protein